MKRRMVAVLGALVLVLAVAAAAAGGALNGRDRNTWVSGHSPMMSGSSLTERDFLVEMVAHHEEAIVAAEQLLHVLHALSCAPSVVASSPPSPRRWSR